MNLSDLSFVKPDTNGPFPRLAVWEPERTNDHQQDTIKGRECFKELADLMVKTENPTLLLRVLEAQVRGGQWSSVEIGFAHQMAEAVMESTLV